MNRAVTGRLRPTTKERDVRFAWSSKYDPRNDDFYAKLGFEHHLIDWIGIHPSKDYDLMFFERTTRGPVHFVYCRQHLRVHSTGWCTVNVDQKVILSGTTYGEAALDADARGLWEECGKTATTSLQR